LAASAAWPRPRIDEPGRCPSGRTGGRRLVGWRSSRQPSCAARVGTHAGRGATSSPDSERTSVSLCGCAPGARIRVGVGGTSRRRQLAHSSRAQIDNGRNARPETAAYESRFRYAPDVGYCPVASRSLICRPSRPR
jgi:hypothetical protein